MAEDTSSGQLIGYVLFFNTLDERAGGGGLDDPIAVIEDLFVKPVFRGRGIATQLWKKVLKVSLNIQTEFSDHFCTFDLRTVVLHILSGCLN